jgi:outer membrane protein assembly factor BamD (BamD/ComL family)
MRDIPKPVSSEVTDNGSTAMTELFPPKIVELRQKIADALTRFDLSTAANYYRVLIKEDPHHVLHRNAQLDVANQLMSEQDYAMAAEAYEKYLARYSAGDQIEQVQLLLGIIYSRYIPQPGRARELLEKARERLKDQNQVHLCEVELGHLSQN